MVGIHSSLCHAIKYVFNCVLLNIIKNTRLMMYNLDYGISLWQFLRENIDKISTCTVNSDTRFKEFTAGIFMF